MLFSLLAAAALVAPAETPAPAAEDHGAITWFEGTYEEALAKAAAEDRLVFIDFWTDWCVWCKRLDADVFSQESVGTAMSDILCLSIDAESETGAPIAKQFNVKGFPTLLLLEADGSVRDSIGGYMPPEDFIAEIERIQRDEGTLGGLRRKVEAEPSNLDARFEYAVKLESVGDQEGYAAQIAAIKELDPEGTSVAVHTLRLAEITKQINSEAGSGKYVELGPLLAFLEGETNTELLFDGYSLAWRVGNFHTRMASIDGSEEAVIQEHKANELAMARKAWEYVPEEIAAPFGNQLAWMAWEARESISDAHKAFALEVAEAAVAGLGSEEDPSMLDTLACVRFMNGDRDGALEAVKRSLELDPENETFAGRWVEFSAEG